ncbi:N-acetylmuramoyl-L-alanine amidase [Loigolactobacillus backii]|uniref:N-acetylmuramoyl-L-alanine amidase n=1 Tax=Loigolactobacillus backii TaxID=375175 RepID=UPI000C1C92EC|nr:N-acetylmuramoyl-L-alanine amidase [Loigolactobacillus backii]PIO83523.1 N-acetylmuramoyl-L-alanine amidase [Loigolactobacillus backii]
MLRRFVHCIILLLACVTLILLVNQSVTAASKTITVQASRVNVRMGPGLAYDTMTQLKHGAKIHIITTKNGWYQVRLASDKIGWVASWLVNNSEVSSAANQKGTMNETIYAREHPDSSSQILGTMTANTPVTIIYQQGAWSQIIFKNTVAWLPSHTITQQNNNQQTQTVDPTIKTMTVRSDQAKLRTGPAINHQIIATLKKQANLTYIATDGDWYKVKTAAGQTGYIANWLVNLNSTTPNNATNLSEATIVLDPGHGGRDSGAISLKKTYEKTFTLATAKAIAARLRSAGARVILTRNKDKYVGLSPRPAIAKRVHADAFISIHFDSSETANTGSGTTTYYYKKKKDLALAKALDQQLKQLPLNSRGTDFGNFLVLRDNTRPAVLLELGYINNKHDYREIQERAYQKQVATDVYQGLSHYFKQ